MKTKRMGRFSTIVACVVAGAVVAGLCPAASAINTWTEGADAGSLPATATVPTGLNPLDEIRGAVGPASGTDKVDMFKIFIFDPSQFSAIVQGGGADPVLFLFDENGLGLLRNDEGPIGHSPEFPVGSLTGQLPGIYFLAITPYTVEPFSAGGAIFPTSGGNGVLDGPTGPGGGSPITGWTVGSADDPVNYVITLTGARTVSVVPEPVTASLSVMGLGALVLVARRRRA